MRPEGFLPEFVSTLVNDSGKGDVGTRRLVPQRPCPDQALEV